MPNTEKTLNRISSSFRKGPVVLVSRKIEFTFILSYAYLAGYLKKMGEDVKILFRPPISQFHALVKQIIDADPVLVGFGSLYPELSEISSLIKMLDDAGRKFPIVIGGQMVTPIPEFAVGITGADFGIVGEGEITLYNLVKALREGKDAATVKGLVIRSANGFVPTGPGEFIEDLDELPEIPYDLFPVDEWLNIGRWYTRYCPQPHWKFNDRVINVHAGRGCPFTCNFCYHHSKPRFRSMNLALDEASRALARFNGNMLYFSDETTLYSPSRAQQMLEGIRALPKRVEYSVSSRFDILDKINDDLLREMKETGCRIMGLGIESGSDRILKVIGKDFSSQTILRGLERLKKFGILPTVSVMIGQLTETTQDAEASIALMRESVRYNKNIQYAFTIATPFPGSKLYDLIFQKGYLRNDKEFYDLYFQNKRGDFKQVVNLSGMRDEELVIMYNKIQNIYKEEKSEVNKTGVAEVEFLMRGAATVHEFLDRKLKADPLLKKACWMSILDKARQWLYEFIQTRLDEFRLRLRGALPWS